MRFGRLLKNKKMWYSVLILVVVLIGIGIFARNSNGTYELLSVERRDVVEEVEVSGIVEAGIVADMGLDASGRVDGVFVKVGDTVSTGQTLISLDTGTLAAQLASAQADVLLRRAETRNTEVNLDEIIKEQDTLVESAYRDLLSTALVAIPQSATYDVAAPTINGLYDGAEGTYKIQIKSGTNPDDLELLTFDLERTGPVDIIEEGSTPLGTRGLFIEFSDELSEYDNTTWYVTIPNTTSSFYLASFNAYQGALRTRDRTIAEAEAELTNRTDDGSITEAQLAKAEAEVARIEAELTKYTLRAPFAGIVTRVDADLGETNPAGTAVVSLISPDLGVEIDLPEIDSVKVNTNDPALITFDALSDGASLPGTVVSVNQTETIADGVPVYEARLAFAEESNVVRSGMTATVTITTDKREQVLAVPVRAVRFREDGSTYILTNGDKKVPQETDVAVGLRGSDGYIEILSGLSEGQSVLVER